MKNKVHLSFGARSVIVQAPPEILQWGQYQFPKICRLADGGLHVTFSELARDRADDFDRPPGYAVSYDGGAAWNRTDAGGDGLVLSDGGCLRLKRRKPFCTDEIELPECVCSSANNWGTVSRYFRKSELRREYRECLFEKRSNGGAEWETINASVNVPGALAGVDYDIQAARENPPESIAGVLMGYENKYSKIYEFENGKIWMTTEECFEDAKYPNHHHAVYLLSEDGGFTFNERGRIMFDYDGSYSSYSSVDPKSRTMGFSEPKLTRLPDGSLLTLLRLNGLGFPEKPYISRSCDDGRTWTIPVIFDDRTAYPALLTLKNGVTAASYGRPGLFLRAAADPKGLQWDERITIIPALGAAVIPSDTDDYCGCKWDGCANPEMIEDGCDTFLLVYSDFNYPNEQGAPCKTILCQRITAEYGF